MKKALLSSAPINRVARLLCNTLLSLALSSAASAGGGNLVQDASFESGLRPWFEEQGRGAYFLATEKVADAKDGARILSISGWDSRGSLIVSPPISLDGEVMWSATMALRLRDDAAAESVPLKVELLLIEVGGTKVLARFGAIELTDGAQWSCLAGEGAKLEVPVEKGRLAVRIVGAQLGRKLEVDSVGLFAGTSCREVGDNAQVIAFEASELAGEGAWKAVSGDGGTMYFDKPIGAQVLSGAEALRGDGDHTNEAVRKVDVHHAGEHRLWVRFLRVQNLPGSFTMAVRQNGEVLASTEVATDDSAHGPPWHWKWVSLNAKLEQGEAEIVLSRPDKASSWVSRRIDYVCLTNMTDFEPTPSDFKPASYLRFINRSEEGEPFCLWFFVRRHIGPHWYSTPGILSHAGFSGGYGVPRDKSKWLAPGQGSPWVRISDHLLEAKGRNNIRMVATRRDHNGGFVAERVQGELQFAVGDERAIVKTIVIDQEAPNFPFTAPRDFRQAEAILSGFDYQQRSEAALSEKDALPQGELPRHIEVSGHLSLRVGLDDPRLIEKEIEIMQRLGMFNIYTPITPPEEAMAFHHKMKLLPRFGVRNLSAVATVAKGAEGVAELGDVAQKEALAAAEIIDNVHHLMLADEPTAPSYDAMLASAALKAEFPQWLQAQGVSLETLGIDSWEGARLVAPAEKLQHPAMFYYTGLFRLHVMVDRVKKAHAVYKKHFPATALTAVNLSPEVFSGISDEQGHDEYLLYRNGGPDLMWTEDWPGYGASVQQMSSYLAMLRVAGRPEGKPLGGFLIPSANAEVQRIKSYIWLAEGVKMLNLYAYGPFYAGIDSWSTRYDAFPTVAAVGREIRSLDAALDGVTRHPAEIAILYNRTAGIWRDFASNTEQDSRYIHWALNHSRYDADILPEEDLTPATLARYKVLYLNGVQIRRKAAEEVRDWVGAGGVLVGSAGAATRDEFNKPLEVLEEVFGAESQDLANVKEAKRAIYETRLLAPIGIVRSIGDAASMELERLGIAEKLLPSPTAKVTMEGGGQPMGVLNSYGKGRAVRWAFLPGLAYIKEAIADKEYDVKSFLPRRYRPELRALIASPATMAGVERVVETTAPLATVTRWQHPKREILYVIDYSGKPMNDFTMVVPAATGFTKARTLQGHPVTLKALEGGALEIAFPLLTADAVILERD